MGWVGSGRVCVRALRAVRTSSSLNQAGGESLVPNLSVLRKPYASRGSWPKMSCACACVYVCVHLRLRLWVSDNMAKTQNIQPERAALFFPRHEPTSATWISSVVSVTAQYDLKGTWTVRFRPSFHSTAPCRAGRVASSFWYSSEPSTVSVGFGGKGVVGNEEETKINQPYHHHHHPRP